MKRAALLIAMLMLAACGKMGGSYMNTDDAAVPEPIPDEKEADWRLYGEQPGLKIEVSWESIGHDDSFGSDEYVYVWVRRSFDKNQESKDGDVYRREYSRFALDCAKSEMASIAIELHDSDDDEVSRKDVPGFQWVFDPVTQQTYMQDFFTQVCKIKP